MNQNYKSTIAKAIKVNQLLKLAINGNKVHQIQRMQKIVNKIYSLPLESWAVSQDYKITDYDRKTYGT